MNEEGPVPDEAMENLKEAAQLIRATQNRLWSAGKIDPPVYRELTHRVSSGTGDDGSCVRRGQE